MNQISSLPPSVTTWNMVGPFIKSLVQPSMTTEDILISPVSSPEGVVSELTELYKATAYMLRSVATILKIEKKPLFGAFNTRQVMLAFASSRTIEPLERLH